MCPCFHKSIFPVVAAALLLSACGSTRIKTGNLSEVEPANQGTQAASPVVTDTTAAVPPSKRPFGNNTGMPDANRGGERFEPNAMQDISDQALQAWRVATAHDKDGKPAGDVAQQAADQKQALAQLAVLEEKYPSQSTVLLMKGQVYEHFGDHAEAIKYYHQASKRNLVNSMALFKSAQEEQKVGQVDEAIADYRKLISAAPEFPPARLGLARCLLQKDPKSAEAQKMLEAMLAKDPQYTPAQELLQSIKH
jgi:tetratricopeptide (TPR) repeat protein